MNAERKRLALWNGNDPILKERMFGLTGPEGNHGEDVKESYAYLDGTPTHSYMRMLYKYPQAPFPYARLGEENGRRSRHEPEFELLDTGIFDGDRYFDVTIEYAKAAADDMLMRVTVANRGPEVARIDVLPTLWCRNTWTWDARAERPRIERGVSVGESDVLMASIPDLGTWWLYARQPDEILFTENETNTERLFGTPNASPYVKDAFHAYVVDGRRDAVNPIPTGTKAAIRWQRTIPAGESLAFDVRLSAKQHAAPFGRSFDETFARRLREADEFYADLAPFPIDADHRLVQRQAFAALLWSKQRYHYIVRDWLAGDSAMISPPASSRGGRNADWDHLYSDDIFSMPDTWEYPWFAASAPFCAAMPSDRSR